MAQPGLVSRWWHDRKSAIGRLLGRLLLSYTVRWRGWTRSRSRFCQFCGYLIEGFEAHECRSTVCRVHTSFFFFFFHGVNHGSSGSFKVHAVDNDPQMTAVVAGRPGKCDCRGPWLAVSTRLSSWYVMMLMMMLMEQHSQISITTDSV